MVADDGLHYDTNWFHNQRMPSDRPQRLLSDDRLDVILHALSDRTRRMLLRRLASGPATMTELAEPFSITRVAVAKHVRVLEAAGLVSRSVAGRERCCSMNAEALKELEDWFKDYRAFWSQRLESLARFVEAGSPTGHRARRKA
jgi:DNA-binding transcriptional ArsR family regulator